ncbi:MAG: hypothetical protein ACR2MG_08540 [Pyrinomonadaceae bacterium]
MRKTTVLTALFCLLLATGAVFAQDKTTNQTKTTNFAGIWELDAAKSKMSKRMRVESITMNVAQTDKELKVESTIKRGAPTEEKRADVNGGMMGGTGRVGGGMRGAMMDGTQTVSYSLDGKETKLETPGIPGAGATLKATLEKDGKLKLTSSRTFNGQMGEMTATTRETWELTDGGKTLKVTRDTESPRGTQSSEMYFTRKQ